MMSLLKLLRALVVVLALVDLGAAAYFTQDRWKPLLDKSPATEPHDHDHATPPAGKIVLSDTAIANLKLTAKPALTTTYWKTVSLPGTIIDRPGRSDQGIVAPVSGVITTIDRIPGDAINPGDRLFTLRILSESLHQSQTNLFRTTQDIALAREQKARLVAGGDAIPEARRVEIDTQIARLETARTAGRLELANRGFTAAQIDGVADGRFVSELPVTAPKLPEVKAWEIQDLKVERGQQVEAGQTLALLANHQSLMIEGRAFRDELPLIEATIAEDRPVQVDFQEDATSGWGGRPQEFHIHHLANIIEPVSRTFDFCMHLENQSKTVTHDGHTMILWRYRPGQRVRILLRSAKHEEVYVVPVEAVVRDGAESYVFTQNVNTFEKVPVEIVAQDRQSVALAKTSLMPGTFIVQTNAAWLLRLSRTSTSGVPPGYHMHADGSLHKNGEPE